MTVSSRDLPGAAHRSDEGSWWASRDRVPIDTTLHEIAARRVRRGRFAGLLGIFLTTREPLPPTGEEPKMAKVIAITNLAGELIGVLRADPVDIGDGQTIRSVPVQTSKQKHHILEVADDLMGKPAHEIHREVRHHLARSKSHG